MFIWSAIAHLLAVVSPGPDTALIIRQVARGGRLSGYYAAVGIGVGVFIHSVLASSGISLLVLSNANLKFIISLLGGLYLIYIGILSFIPNKNVKDVQNIYEYNASSFFKGLLTNLLNIKAFIFFISLFTIITDSLNGIWLFLYPLYFSIMTMAWFCFLSFILTSPKLNFLFKKYDVQIEKFSSAFLVFIGLLIIFNTFYVN
jgi:threonine/homoserine/homoserine lactone efflux protein